MAGNKGQQEEIELKSRIKLFDPDGSLSEACREIWALIEPAKEAIAREFWLEYGRAPELKTPLSESKIGEMVQRITPYLEMRHLNLHSREWVDRAAETWLPARSSRFLPALTSYADALGDGETGIVVSHGAALRVAVPAFLEWHGEVAESLGVLANCGWIVLEHSASTWTGGVVRWRLAAWNRVAG